MATAPVRPTGITILAILAAIGGILGLLFGAFGGACAIFTGLFTFLGLISLLFVIAYSVLDLAFAYGAWMAMPWAWQLGVVAEGLAVVSAIITWANGGGFGSFLLSVIIAGAILYYLFTPAVKHYFGRA
jgi:hypothetical protein